MEETKKSSSTPVVLKRSRLGLNIKSAVKAKHPATLSNGNGINSNDEKSELTPEIASVEEKDTASMSVRNKEICRLHMEETNSINNAQNPDSKSDINEINSTSESNKDASVLNIKKEITDSPAEDTVSASNVDNIESQPEKNNSSDVSVKNIDSSVVKAESDSTSSSTEVVETSEKNGEPVPNSEDSDNKVAKSLNAESVSVESSKDSIKTVDSSKDSKEAVESSKDLKKTVEPTKDLKKAAEPSKDSKKAGTPSKDPKKPVEPSKDLKKVIGPSEDWIKAIEPSKDSTKTVGTSKDSSKAVGSSKDVSKAVESSKDVSKAVESSKDVTKAVGSSKDSPKAIVLPKDPTKAVGSSKDTFKAIGSPKDSKKIVVIKATKDISKNKLSPKPSKELRKSLEEEAQSSGSEEFHGFDSEHTEKSIKAKQDFIGNSEENEVTSSVVPSTPKNEEANSKATPVSNKRMRKNIVDLSNPMYRKPFDFGWKRELVYRATNDDGKRQGDIYYYTPSGKKVRSAREVQEHITDPELTVDNFTFCKEPLGVNDPVKEIIRDAKIRLSKDFAATPPPKTISRTPKVKATATPVSPTTKSTPKLVIKTQTPNSGGLKVKFTGIKSGSTAAKASSPKSKPSKVKKRKSSSGGSSELEMGMLPPMWTSPEVKSDSLSTGRSWSPPTVSESTKNAGKKRSADKSEDKKGSPPSKRIKVDSRVEPPAQVSTVSTAPVVTTTTPNTIVAQENQSKYLMMNVALGYTSIMHIFKYLNLKELLVAARVCRLWHDVASKPQFWQTVRMKNTQVSDWNGFANALIKHETKHLDLRKMLVGSKPEEVKANWLEFYNVIGQVKSLKRIELCRCLSSVIENLAKHVPHLEALTATTIKSPSLNLEPLAAITSLTELRLKGMSGLELPFNQLTGLTTLKLLSITGIRNLNDESSTVIGALETLETLEIGDCNIIHEKTVTEAIPKLKNLKRLRLEKGQNSVSLIIQMVESASKLPQLEILELINFDVKPGFDIALEKCTNIKSLLMIPTYITQSATTNHIVMVGVSRLAKTLKHFVWGLTLELLRVTDLFIDQCENNAKNSPAQSPNSNGNNAANKKGKGDSIPILKPLIDNLEEGHDIKDPIPPTNANNSGPSKVDILPIPKLRKVLSSVLPTTDIKILKIPFSSTWRQTLVP